LRYTPSITRGAPPTQIEGEPGFTVLTRSEYRFYAKAQNVCPTYINAYF